MTCFQLNHDSRRRRRRRRGVGRIPVQSAFGKRLLRHKQRLPLIGTQEVVQNLKRLRQAHLFTLFLRISSQ